MFEDADFEEADFEEKDPVTRADAAHAAVGRAHRALLAAVAEIDRTEDWQGDGASCVAHWVSMRYGISAWKATRWVATAHALGHLPSTAEALSSGELGIDKVVELCRFATPHTEAKLLRWAQRVSSGAIRRRGDLEARRSREEAAEVERDRYLAWWYVDDGRRLALEAELPAGQGAAVINAIQRMAARVPTMPDEEHPSDARGRRADALVALCQAQIAVDPDPDRATVVVHATLEGLVGASSGGHTEGGAVIHPETVRRLLCNARVQAVIEDGKGDVIGLGRLAREPSAWMVRQLRWRDRECRFPGCGARAFTEAHHVQWWGRGGRTDLDNLALICSFHHRLVHEHGWLLSREPDGEVSWFRPGGARYLAGPSPGQPTDEIDRELEQLMLVAVS